MALFNKIRVLMIAVGCAGWSCSRSAEREFDAAPPPPKAHERKTESPHEEQTSVAATQEKRLETAEQRLGAIKALGGFVHVAGPKPGTEFRAGKWGFEVQSIALSPGGIIVEFIVENLSDRAQMVPSTAVYVLDDKRIKHASDRLGDAMANIQRGRESLEQIAPRTRVQREATIKLPPEFIRGKFSVVFQDPSEPTENIRIELSGERHKDVSALSLFLSRCLNYTPAPEESACVDWLAADDVWTWAQGGEPKDTALGSAFDGKELPEELKQMRGRHSSRPDKPRHCPEPDKIIREEYSADGFDSQNPNDRMMCTVLIGLVLADSESSVRKRAIKRVRADQDKASANTKKKH